MENKKESLLDTNEINRLQRAAKNKDKKEIIKWAENFEDAINDKYYNYYRKQLGEWIERASNDIAFDWEVMMTYALHFDPKTKFGFKRVYSFMESVRELVRGLNRNEFSRDEYIKELKAEGIEFYLKEK